MDDDRAKSKDIARSKSGALVAKEVQGTGARVSRRIVILLPCMRMARGEQRFNHMLCTHQLRSFSCSPMIARHALLPHTVTLLSSRQGYDSGMPWEGYISIGHVEQWMRVLMICLSGEFAGVLQVGPALLCGSGTWQTSAGPQSPS